jgi:hypothetical protein
MAGPPAVKEGDATNITAKLVENFTVPSVMQPLRKANKRYIP